MSTGSILTELAQQIRGFTLKLLSEAQPQWLRFAPAGTTNHMLWHAGHALWLQDVLGVQLLSGRSELPDGWAETFGSNCQPLAFTRRWPTQDEVRNLLEAQLQRISQLLHAASEEQLQSVANSSRGSATIAQRIIHGWHDEAKHSGEMYLLLKLCRAGADLRQA